MPKFEDVFFEALNNLSNNMKNLPLNLGGISYSGGGAGGPPGGFVGQLPQTRVAYDYTEEGTLYTPSGVSLLDNLNHIRYQITTLASGGDPSFTILDNGVLVVSGVTNLNFEGDFSITPFANGVTISVSGAQGEPGVTDLTIQEEDIIVLSGVKTINFEGAVSVVAEGSDKVTVTMSGGGTSDLTLPFMEDVGIYTTPSGALHVKPSGIDQVPLIVQGTIIPAETPMWVAGTNDARVLVYSTDMDTWTGCTFTDNLADYSSVYGIIKFGNKWIAVGAFTDLDTSDQFQMLSSTDGITWSHVGTVDTPFVGGYSTCIAYTDNKIIVGGWGNDGTQYGLAYSTDGTTWYPIYNDMNKDVYCIATNGTAWLAGGECNSNSDVFAYSPDGTSWDTYGSSFATQINTVLWVGDKWLAGGNGNSTNNIFSSSNGTSWSEIAVGFTNKCTSMDYDGVGKIIAVGENTRASEQSPIIYSEDGGSNWTEINLYTLCTGLGVNAMEVVKHNGLTWMVNGKDCTTVPNQRFNAYSSNGVSWTFILNETDDGANAVSFSAIGNNEIGDSYAVSQAANLTEWRDSDYNLLGYIDKDGNAYFPNISGATVSGITEETDPIWGSEKILYLTKVEASGVYETLLPATPADPTTKFLNGNRQWATISGGSGTTDHSELTNLDYASAGHTGFEPAKGADDNYVTDAEKIAIANLSGTNTGDVTVTDTSLINLTISGQVLSADIILPNDSSKYLNGVGSWVTVSGGTSTGSTDILQVQIFS